MSNGHHWITYSGHESVACAIVCCRDCGIVRRADDQNKPCKGVVHIGLREVAPVSRPQSNSLEDKEGSQS